jgi:hypothetical protein
MNFLTLAAQSAGRLFRPAKSGRKPWEKQGANLIEYEMAGQKRRASNTWYRGEHCNYHPFRASLSEPAAIDRYFGHGWMPAAPFITRQAPITTFGSCFASHVSKFLARSGYNLADKGRNNQSYVIRCGEGMVNSAAIAQQFQWAYGEVGFDESLWYEANGSVADYSAAVRDETRAIFDRTEVFIITLGLSEVWYNRHTNDVFWRTIPKEKFDPDLHGFKVLGADENRANLATAYRLIRQHRPQATVIFTLSPVPLAATFRPVSCITANSVSKASLRIAVDEVMRQNAGDEQLFYFPSYELVKEYFDDPYLEDLRHIRPEVVEQIMQTFARHFLVN